MYYGYIDFKMFLSQPSGLCRVENDEKKNRIVTKTSSICANFLLCYQLRKPQFKIDIRN